MTMHNHDLECILNGTSSEYDIQTFYNGNGFLGIITELPQVYLAIYGTHINPFSYTGSEHIDITYNNISSHFPINVHDGIVLNPRAYGGAVFEMISGTDSFVF